MIDMHAVKFEIPVRISKDMDKGEIAKAYKKIYELADQLSAAETSRYMAKKPLEYVDEKFREGATDNKKSWALRTANSVTQYKERRLKYHIDNMLRLLELHMTTRQAGKK